MHCKCVSLSLSVLHTQLGLHTIVDAELSPICVTQSQNITPVRAKRGKKRVGREKRAENAMLASGGEWEGVAEEDEEEKRKIYIQHIHTSMCSQCGRSVPLKYGTEGQGME